MSRTSTIRPGSVAHRVLAASTDVPADLDALALRAGLAPCNAAREAKYLTRQGFLAISGRRAVSGRRYSKGTRYAITPDGMQERQLLGPVA